MTHAQDCKVYETKDLTPGCNACQELRVGDLDSAVLKTITGMDKLDVEALFAGSAAPFRYAVAWANAMQVRSEYRELLRKGWQPSPPLGVGLPRPS